MPRLLALLALLPLPTHAAPPTPTQIERITVTARKLAVARTRIQTRIGATTTTLPAAAIHAQPGGAELPLNQTLLQTPGVSQDSFGQIHLRNDHANIQYRIDGVILPEGISFFGQSLTSRFASSIDLVTGSLPAQYGLVTTGIIDIQTKSGALTPGGEPRGSISLYGGSHTWLEPSLEAAGASGSLTYYLAADALHDTIGIESPTKAPNPLHDTTEQAHAFADIEDILDASSKLTAIIGAYQGRFQIPDAPNQPTQFTNEAAPLATSATLNEHQAETNDYAVLSYLTATPNTALQLSAFVRGSRLAYTPDQNGDLQFYGQAQTATRNDLAEGIQADASATLSPTHTLRYGLLLTAERATSQTTSQVFPCPTQDCAIPATTPEAIADNSAQTGTTYSAYLQDEWRLLPSLTLNAGLRYDILNAYTSAQQASPRVNLVWQPTRATTLHAGYARYFTPPSLELISGQSIAKFANTSGYPAGYTPSAPPKDGPILPERANYLDAGADHTILPGLKLGVDLYWKIARNLIDEGQFGAPIILSVFNYAHANVLGAEFTASLTRGRWSTYANLSLGRERATQLASQQFNFTPADLTYIAHHYIYTDHSQFITASAGAAYTIAGTTLTTDLIYGSGLREDSATIPNGAAVAPYLQLNLGATHHFAHVWGAPLELTLAILNVTDRAYEIRSGTGVGVFAPQYGPRRAVYAGLRKFF